MLQSHRRWASWTWTVAFAVSISGVAATDDIVVKRFSGGDSATSVGIADASEDVELTGPQALTADASGNLFLLDQLNQRIVRFDPKRPAEDPSILEMPDSVQPNDLLVRKDEILVWDGGIRTLKAAAEPQSTRGVGNTPAAGVKRLAPVDQTGGDQHAGNRRCLCHVGIRPNGIATAGNPVELLDQNTRAVTIKQGRKPTRQYVASRGRGSVIADITPEKGDNSVLVEVRTMDDNSVVSQICLRVRDKLGAVEFLEIDNNERLYILAENIPDASSGATTFVARYAADGALEGSTSFRWRTRR